METELIQSRIAELAKDHGRQVFLTAFRIIGDKHLAEDVTQDVFIKLFKKNLKMFDEISNWPAYMKTIAVSTSLDLLRKRGRRKEQALDSDSHQDLAAENNEHPDIQVMSEQYLLAIRNGITQIPEQEGQAFLLRFIEELSYQEIAAQLDINRNYVGVLINRAKQKLSQLLNQTQLFGETL